MIDDEKEKKRGAVPELPCWIGSRFLRDGGRVCSTLDEVLDYATDGGRLEARLARFLECGLDPQFVLGPETARIAAHYNGLKRWGFASYYATPHDCPAWVWDAINLLDAAIDTEIARKHKPGKQTDEPGSKPRPRN